MKKMVMFSLILLVFAGWGGRVYYVNASARQPQKEVYPMNTYVHFEDNFTMDSSENLNGYSICVMDAEIKTYEEYISEYGETISAIAYDTEEGGSYHPLYVYDVVVKIENSANKDGGINLFYFKLQTDDYYLQLDQNLWGLSYPKLEGAMCFCLLEDTALEFRLPFVMTMDIEAEYGKVFLEENDFYLVISEYPKKQMIRVDN